MAEGRTRATTDIDFERNGKQTGAINFPHSVHRSAYGQVAVPLICIRNGAGPRVLLVAGNHGDEYEGQVTLIKLAREIEPEQVRGRIIILPAANFPAVLAGERNSPIEPGEKGNLNRSFPGDPDGSLTEMIAHYIDSVLLAQSEYVFDLHSGGSSLMYIPCTQVWEADDPAKADRAIEIAKVFGAPIGEVGIASVTRNLGSASKRRGLIHVGTELGGGGTCSPDILAIAERGLRRALRHIGALVASGPEQEAPGTRLVYARGPDFYVYSPDSGICEPFVDLGAEVEKGQSAAAIHFPETPWREPVIVRFRRSGFVLCKRVPSLTRRGDCLFQIATDYVNK